MAAPPLFYDRRLVAVEIGVIAVSYGIVVINQPTQFELLARWLFAVVLVIVPVTIVAFVADTAGRLRQQLEHLAESQRLDRLGRFLSPLVARAVLNLEDEGLLDPHRREIAVVFIDLRNFSRFTADVEPEEVIGVLSEYFQVTGEVLSTHQATVGQIQGDGVMAYFNDPLPCEEPARRAAETALALKPRLDVLTERWKGLGYDIGYGIGISLGYATLGVIGFEGRREYGPVGTVANLASRLCGRAEHGQVLMDQRTFARIDSHFEAAHLAPMDIKGFPQPIAVVSIVSPKATTPGEQAKTSVSSEPLEPGR
jgi:class 3 adenylate cyclase